MNLSTAIAADQGGDIQAAAAAYEAALAEGERSLRGMLNLAVLYWQATDFGLSTARKLDQRFVEHAARRFPVVLAEAQRAFPESTEVEFWRRYIQWADVGEAFAPEACRELLERDPTTLVPAMRLFGQAKGESYREEALELLRQCQQDGTTRARYVASVLQGVIKRANRPRT